MTDRTLAWELPVVTPRQRPIKHTQIDFRVDASLPWTPAATVPPTDPQQVEFLDVNAGTFDYRLTIYDDEDTPGDEVIVSQSLAFDPPGTVLNVTITDV